MNKIDPELSRVLRKRIVSALLKAKYYPAQLDNAESIAKEIVRPYLETEKADDIAPTTARILTRKD